MLNTNIDIKGKAYEEIVGANLRGDRGEFFTPRNIMKMTVEMINPKVNERVLDSSCGTGGFLVNAMTHVMEELEKKFIEETGIPKAEWNNDFQKCIRTESRRWRKPIILDLT
ncbi:MAG: SAM-dependent methyltransferase [Treponema sp.]|nr:SAM-dependent methyltransferase [Treponema sp.]